MKKTILAICALFFCSISNAKVKDISNYMDFATKEEKSDLIKLLQQIKLVPAKDPDSGRQVLKVASLDKGSVYDRIGLKVGDLVEMNHGNSKSKNMEIKQPLRKSK